MEIVIILLLIAVLLRYGAFGERWRGVIRGAMRPALVLGGIGFVIGLIYGVVREGHRSG